MIVLTKADEDGLEFENGSIVVTDRHEQACCEHVYADFTQLSDKVGQTFPNLEVEKVPNSGFRIGGEFVPCYNSQNGHYSSNLVLVITLPDLDHEMTVDITDCTLDDLG